jgi:molybdopterin-guanine dinucleotide biosynthesis protein A
VVERVQAVTGALPLLIANAPGASAWRPDLKTIPDTRPGFGSLGGIYSAVTAAPEPVLCVAWDMPFVPQGLLQALIEGATRGGAGGAGHYDAFLPESSGRRGLEPLCAVYGPACGPAIARRLETGDLKAISFHADVSVGILSLAQVRAFGDPEEMFFNVNMPDDLERAEALWRRRG